MEVEIEGGRAAQHHQPEESSQMPSNRTAARSTPNSTVGALWPYLGPRVGLDVLHAVLDHLAATDRLGASMYVLAPAYSALCTEVSHA